MCSLELKLWGFPPQRGGLGLSSHFHLPGWQGQSGGCRKPEEEESRCGTPIVVRQRLNMCRCKDVSLRHLFTTGFRIYLANVSNGRVTRTAAARVGQYPIRSGTLICQTRFRISPVKVLCCLAWFLFTHTGRHTRRHTHRPSRSQFGAEIVNHFSSIPKITQWPQSSHRSWILCLKVKHRKCF